MYGCYFSNSIYLKYHAEEARHSEVKYNIYYVVQHLRLQLCSLACHQASLNPLIILWYFHTILMLLNYFQLKNKFVTIDLPTIFSLIRCWYQVTYSCWIYKWKHNRRILGYIISSSICINRLLFRFFLLFCFLFFCLLNWWHLIIDA